MPTIPYEVVAESRLRFNLRLPDPVAGDPLTARLAEVLGEAVSFVEQMSSIPIYDQTGYVEVYPVPGRDCPVEVTLPYVRSVDGVRYWENADVREEPDKTIQPSELGRIVLPSSRVKPILVYPPEGGWADQVLTDGLQVLVTRAYLTPPQGVCSAVIAGARQLFNGADEITATAAMYAWVMPWQITATHMDEFIHDERQSVTVPISSVTTIHPVWIGWSSDAVIDNPELTIQSQSGILKLPPDTGFKYIAIWRSDVDGGDPSVVHIGPSGNSRSLFGAASTRVINGLNGKLIVTTNRQNADILSGEIVRVA